MVDTIVRLGSNCGDCLAKAIASQLMTEGSQKSFVRDFNLGSGEKE